MTTIVVSAVNCVEGGTLRVFIAAVRAAAEVFSDWRVVVLANNRDLIDVPGVVVYEFPGAKRRYASRLWHEWVVFRRLSAKLKPEIWLSMHDITANVPGCRHFVYCHNPMPFYRVPFREAIHQPITFFQNALYGALYRAYLGRNDAVIVQQQWLRDYFIRWGARQVIVAHPVERAENPSLSRSIRSSRFFFPSLARPFKNFETVCEAAKLLADDPRWRGETLITIAGNENRYAKWLRARFDQVPGLRFIGRQSYSEMALRYEEADCVVFPSKIETWGLPITEAKTRGIPLIVSDEPYAHETVGRYDYVRFFPATDARRLADLMLEAHLNGWTPTPECPPDPAEPFAPDWLALMRYLRDGSEAGLSCQVEGNCSEVRP